MVVNSLDQIQYIISKSILIILEMEKKSLFTVTLYLLVEQHLLYQNKSKQRKNLHNK